MFNAKELFTTRFQAHIKETIRYLQYIFSGHIAVALIFLVGAGAFYYQQILERLPDNFPTSIVVAFMFALVVIHTPIQTLLKEADLVFLLPAELKMKNYFAYTLIYSYVIQLYIVLVVLAVLAPLYFASYPNQTGRTYLLLAFLLVFLKGWNLMASWWLLKVRDKSTRVIDKGFRFLLQFFIFYFFINDLTTFATVLTVSLFILFYYSYLLSTKNSLAWDQLIEKDQMRMRSFYRLANMFTDVPHLKAKVKKRHVLVGLVTQFLELKRANTYTYLFRITTIRSADYLGIYTRLTLVGTLAVAYVPNSYVALGFGLLFMYLTAVQLMTIWHHHRTLLWIDLYPISMELRQKGLIRWVQTLLFIQVIWFSIVFAIMEIWHSVALIGVIGIVFILAFPPSYLKSKTN